MRNLINSIANILGFEPIGMPHAVALHVKATDGTTTTTVDRRVVHLTDGADLEVIIDYPTGPERIREAIDKDRGGPAAGTPQGWA